MRMRLCVYASMRLCYASMRAMRLCVYAYACMRMRLCVYAMCLCAYA